MLCSILLLAALAPVSQDAEAKFQVIHFGARLGEGPMTILERPRNLHYEAPYLTANATVRCDLPEGEEYTVGFVQEVDSKKGRNEYGGAWTSWELPRIPIGDTGRGEKTPWYRRGIGTSAVRGGASLVLAVVAMDDNLTGDVTWNEPLPPDGERSAVEPGLKRVTRAQSFTLWLIAMRTRDQRVNVLKKATWRIEFDIAVNPSRPVGERCKIDGLKTPPPVVEEGGSESPPKEVLTGPAANEAQEFWWNPAPGMPGKRTRMK